MAMQPRERRLAMIVGGLVIALIAVWVVTGIRGAFAMRQTQLDALNRDVAKKRLRVAAAGALNQEFAEWERRSLPSDRELARSQYQNWLVASLNRAKLDQVIVEPGRTSQLRDVYTKLPFTIRAKGSLSEIVAWLAEFYRADHLHQLRDLSFQPPREGNELQIAAMVEALVLPEADRTDKLTATTGARLDEARARAAAETIVKRNFFAPYVPPPPPKVEKPVVKAPPPPPAFDPAKFTFLTSIIYVDERPQAWLNVRPTKQLLKLSEGDGIQVGQFNGRLVRIGDQQIEIDQEGKRRVVSLGHALTEGGEAKKGGS